MKYSISAIHIEKFIYRRSELSYAMLEVQHGILKILIIKLPVLLGQSHSF